MATAVDELKELTSGGVLSALSGTQLARLASESENRFFHKDRGDVWARHGLGDAILLVSEGRFRVSRAIPGQGGRSGRNVLFRFAERGEVLGLSRLVDEPRAGEIVPDGRARAVVMPAQLLRQFFENNQAFARALLRLTREIVGRLADEVVRLRCDLFVDRLIARIEKDLGAHAGELRYTQDDLAQLVGGTASEVSRALRPFSPNVMEWSGGTLVVKNLSEARRLLELRDLIAIDGDLK